MAKSFSELQTLAIQIRDELNKKKNSAQRVGSALLDIIDNCIQNITDIKQKLSVFEHACSGFKRVSSEAQLPVTPSQEDLAKGFLVNTSLYLYVGTGGNAVNGRYFNVGDIRGPQGEPGSKGETGNTGPTGEKGEQGNSGVTGDTSDIVVINNLDGGESEEGSIKVLAAEQGKVLNKKFTEFEGGNSNNISKVLGLRLEYLGLYVNNYNAGSLTASEGEKNGLFTYVEPNTEYRIENVSVLYPNAAIQCYSGDKIGNIGYTNIQDGKFTTLDGTRSIVISVNTSLTNNPVLKSSESTLKENVDNNTKNISTNTENISTNIEDIKNTNSILYYPVEVFPHEILKNSYLDADGGIRTFNGYTSYVYKVEKNAYYVVDGQKANASNTLYVQWDADRIVIQRPSTSVYPPQIIKPLDDCKYIVTTFATKLYKLEYNNIDRIDNLLKDIGTENAEIKIEGVISGNTFIKSDGTLEKNGSYSFLINMYEVEENCLYRINGKGLATGSFLTSRQKYCITSNVNKETTPYVVDVDDVLLVGPTIQQWDDAGGNYVILMPKGAKYLFCSNNPTVSKITGTLGINTTKTCICYGDSLTAGSDAAFDETTGTGPYVSVLKRLLGDKWNTLNKGIGGEDSATIAGRQGGVPFYITNDINLPADTSQVALPKDTDEEGGEIGLGIANKCNSYVSYTKKLLCQGGLINPITINGIECTLTKTGQYTATEYQIKRNTAGEATKLLKGSFIYTQEMKVATTADMCVIFIGQNGGYDSAETLVKQVKSMIQFCNCGEQYITITSHGNGYENIREAFDAEFGAKNINLQTYLPNYGIRDAIRYGLATKEDMDGHVWDDGTLKPNNDVHLTTLGYAVVAHKIYETMRNIGYVE